MCGATREGMAVAVATPATSAGKASDAEARGEWGDDKENGADGDIMFVGSSSGSSATSARVAAPSAPFPTPFVRTISDSSCEGDVICTSSTAAGHSSKAWGKQPATAKAHPASPLSHHDNGSNVHKRRRVNVHLCIGDSDGDGAGSADASGAGAAVTEDDDIYFMETGETGLSLRQIRRRQRKEAEAASVAG